MERVAVPLRNMGANIKMENDHAPIQIYPSGQIIGCKQKLNIPSAQIKSAILLAALYANSETVVSSNLITRNHTELMLETFGCPISFNDSEIKIKNGERDMVCKFGQMVQNMKDSFLKIKQMVLEDSSL